MMIFGLLLRKSNNFITTSCLNNRAACFFVSIWVSLIFDRIDFAVSALTEVINNDRLHLIPNIVTHRKHKVYFFFCKYHYFCLAGFILHRRFPVICENVVKGTILRSPNMHVTLYTDELFHQLRQYVPDELHKTSMRQMIRT